MVAYSRRRFLQTMVFFGFIGTTGTGVTSCGRPLTPGVGGVPLVTQPIQGTAEVAATLTAFAAVPTKTDRSPDAPANPEPTLIVPTAARDTLVPTKAIPSSVPIPTIDADAPCIRIVSGSDGATPQRVALSADRIVLGLVQGLQTARWDTPDGQRPMDACGGPPYHHIITPVILQVVQVIKGSGAIGQNLAIAAPGGSVGPDREARNAELPIAVGERSLLFINNQGDRIVGRYIVDDGGMATDSANVAYRVPLQQLLADIAPFLPRATTTATPR